MNEKKFGLPHGLGFLRFRLNNKLLYLVILFAAKIDIILAYFCYAMFLIYNH